MSEVVHIIPVGFDFDRLAQPISKGNLEADRIRLLHSASGSSEGVLALASRMMEQLEFTFDRLLGIEVETGDITDVFDYEDAYIEAHQMISREIENGNQVWINISSMPRTVAFAFATAANAMIVEDPSLRDSIHTYYVSPERYLVMDMIEELRKTRDFLQERAGGDNSDEMEERLNSIHQLISEIDSSGVTKGAKQMNGDLHVEFPAVAFGELGEFEEDIISFLNRKGATKSTSELARLLANQTAQEADDAFRSKVQYNVKRLQEKGYVDRIERDNSYETRLSTMGKLWAESHL